MGVGDYTRFRAEFTKRPGPKLEAPVPPEEKKANEET